MAEQNNTAEEPIVEMARRLDGLWKRAEKLEDMARKLEKDTDEREVLERAERTTWTELYALQDYMVSIPCETLAGAAVHIMLASAMNDICRTSLGVEDIYSQIDRALRSAMQVVAKAAGLDMNQVGATHYAPEWSNPFPAVDAAAKEMRAIKVKMEALGLKEVASPGDAP